MSRSEQAMQTRASRADNERINQSLTMIREDRRHQSWGVLAEKIGAEGSEQVNKTRRNRVELEDRI